jgi:flagellar protein FlbD
MITLSRLGQSEEHFQLNPDMIVTVEANPDTVITLATGAKVVVTQTPEDVAEAVSAYRSLIISDALRGRRMPRSAVARAAKARESSLRAVDDASA